MTTRTHDHITKVTSELSNELLREQLNALSDLDFVPLPQAHNGDGPVWRVRLDLTFDSQAQAGIDINGDVILGRTPDSLPGLFRGLDVENLGVSRQHAMFRPTESKLYLIDLGSTNGTRLNGRQIGVNTPYSLSNGDLVRLGRLEFTVYILRRPEHTSHNGARPDLAAALPNIARDILSQTDVPDTLEKAMEMAMDFSHAEEVSVWLIDEASGELFLEAGRGLGEQAVRRLPVQDTLAGQVLQSGKPARAQRSRSGSQIKLKTNYLVEAVLYVPLALGGTTFGVLSAVHRSGGGVFTDQDEKALAAIADLTALAVHNARQHHALARAAARRAKIINAFSSALSLDMKNLANAAIGYAGLLRTSPEEADDIAEEISRTGGRMVKLIAKLVEATALSDELIPDPDKIDLMDVITAAVDDASRAAAEYGVRLDFQVMGAPYCIVGDGDYLHRAVLYLLHNAIHSTPAEGTASITLAFSNQDTIIRVCDGGPGISATDLAHVFDGCYRSGSDDGQPECIGLELEFVRSAAEAHRGTLTARSGEDGGLEFMMTLPASLRLDAR